MSQNSNQQQGNAGGTAVQSTSQSPQTQAITSGAVINTGTATHGGKITLTDVEVNDMEQSILSTIKRCAPSQVERNLCDQFHKDLIAEGIRLEHQGAGIVVRLSNDLVQGLTKQNWPWTE